MLRQKISIIWFGSFVLGFSILLAQSWETALAGKLALTSPFSQDSTLLVAGQTLERPLAGGEVHHYRLRLAAGQYIKVEVFQYWISVELRLFDPTGKLVLELKLHNDDAQTEMLSAIVEQGGDFRLEVKARGPKEIRSTYQITWTKQHQATVPDRLLVEADRMQLEAYAIARQGKWDEALSLSQKGIAVYAQIYGDNHLELIEPLKLLRVLLMFRSNFSELEKVDSRILAIQEQALGRTHLEVTEGMLYLANCYWLQTKEAQARRFFEQVLAQREKLLPPDHMRIAQVLSDLGNLLVRLNEFTQAERLLRRSMMIAEKTLGTDSYFAVMRWNDLAEVSAALGEYGEAAALWERGASSAEKLFPGSPVYARILMNLGQLYLDMGDYERANRQLQHALPLFVQWWRLESGNTADLLALLGKVAFAQKDLQRAEDFYRRALAIHEKLVGGEHAAIALTVAGLANVLQAQQRYEEAEAAYQRAHAINKSLYPENDWRTDGGSHNWGKLYQTRGDYAKAETLIRRALTSYEKSLGPKHPYTFEVHRDLMTLCVAQGRISEALAEQQRAAEISEFSLSRNLLAGSENQKLRLLEKFGAEVDDTLSLHTQLLPDQPQALQLAFQTLLSRKGRALDEMAQVIRLLRQRADGEGLKLFNQLSDKLAQLSVLTTRGSETPRGETYLAQVQQLNAEIEKLQAALSERSREFQTQTQPITLQAVQAALPVNAALVEFARFKAVDQTNRNKSEDHYAAYILRADGILRWTPLGKATEIERAIEAWRKELSFQSLATSATRPADARRLARRVDALVMQPVRAQLGNLKQVILAPDGALNLLPFAALVDERNRELVRNYLFIYLTSGRDLLRLQIKHQGNADVLLFAAPDYNHVSGASAPSAAEPVVRPSAGQAERAGQRSRNASALDPFEPLPHARAEAEAVQSQFPQARLWLGQAATESAVKQVQRPAILHIATHGAFLPDEGTDNAEAQVQRENPLLRSWLAFAGANQRQRSLNGAEDGILTAYEAATLDLWGTKLVVLSACETGLGEVKNGEGVYGLRRALVLAGAETQLTSLWRIDDRVTKNLMHSYYSKLRAGVGRMAALRQVQLEMLNSRANRHPYFWASFIALGEWANLAGRR